MPQSLRPGERFRVAILLYPNITQLDFTAPLEFLSKVPGVDIGLYWKSLRPITSAGGLEFTPTASFDEMDSIDLLLVPGGPGQVDLMADEEVLEFLHRAADQARFVTSVCTGSLLLAAAGLLQGYRSTTHWMAMEDLSLLGAIAVDERVVIDRNRITGSGVTAGIDFSLTLIAELWGDAVARMVQLALEYDPQPPFDAGSPKTASPEEVQRLLQRSQALLDRRRAATKKAAARLEPHQPD
jgi:cyclohexyl-isocyanide hydratase